MKNRSYKKQFSLAGKTAVVTGGVGVLGREFCRGLAESGADVAVVDLKKQDVEKFAGELRKDYGAEAMGIACDVSDPESVKKMVKQATGHFGHLDILMNNAAAKSKNLKDFFKPFENYSLKTWREIMAVNLDGMFLVAQAVGSQMARSGKGGSIIQTASIYGILGPDPRIYEKSQYLGTKINTPAVYSASKGGVVALTQYLAAYWAEKNIRVNTLTPGGVESGQNKEFKKRYSARIPLRRMADRSEMVGALIYLASDASNYVTGHNLIIDGGLHAW